MTHSGSGKADLCGPGYIHGYTDPLLAVLLNPIHADIVDPLLWRAEGKIAINNRGLQVGCVSLTTIEQIPLPVVTTAQRVRFAILCAMEVCKDPAWRAWAEKWLDGSDRSPRAAARVAVLAARSAATDGLVRTASALAARAATAAAAARNIDLIALAHRAVTEEVAA